MSQVILWLLMTWKAIMCRFKMLQTIPFPPSSWKEVFWQCLSTSLQTSNGKMRTYKDQALIIDSQQAKKDWLRLRDN